MRLQLTLVAVAVALLARGRVASAEGDSAPTKAQSKIVGTASGATTFYADTDHVTVFTPVATGQVGDRFGTWNVRGQYLVDTISAASVDIVSTASQRWHETRQAGNLEGTYKPKDFGVRATAALSSEPDYLSIAGGANLIWDFAQKNHTVAFGYSRAHDTIGRSGTPFSVFSRSLDTDTFTGGVTLTLNRAAALSIVDDVILERGDQSKPYRYVPMFLANVAPTIEKGASLAEVNANRLQQRPLEHLPDHRERAAITGRFGYRFAHSTLRIEERLYTDSWSSHASTTELRYYMDLSRRLMVWPRLRFHAQTPAYFWRRAYVSSFEGGSTLDVPRYFTGDRELGPLETVGVGAGSSFGFGPQEDPSRYAVELQADVMNTQFFDDLYLTSRTAAFVALTFQGAFE